MTFAQELKQKYQEKHQIRDAIEQLKNSIKAECGIVLERGDKYVLIVGNMEHVYAALNELGFPAESYKITSDPYDWPDGALSIRLDQI